MAVNLHLEYWKVGLALLGVFITASIPAYFGYRIARRHEITSSTLEEIKDRATFRQILMDRVKVLSEENAALMQQVVDLSKKHHKMELREMTLLAMVENYEARLKVCEERQEAHELICGPKTEG